MSDKVLVTGSTGQIGTEVVKELIARGASVKAASRQGVEVPGAEATVFSFEQSESFGPALEGVDRVFLLVPAQSIPDANRLVPPFVEAMKAAGIRKVVCMTGMLSDSPDAPLKGTEQAVKDSGIPYAILRPNWFDQNFAPGYYLDMIKGAGGVFLPAADGKVSFVDTRDIGAVAAAALTEDGHDGGEYALTGPDAIDHTQACAILSEASGREIRYAPISEDDYRAALTSEGMPEAGIEGMIDLYRLIRDGLCDEVSGDVASVLGRPPISFEQYAKDHAALLS